MANVFAEVLGRSFIAGKRQELFELMDEFYMNVTQEQFESDLDEKDWVIVLRNQETHRIVGFTTLMTIRTEFQKQNYLVFYSGDTIIEPAYWGSSELVRAWINFVLETAKKSPDCHPYWVLISSSFRTYRFLSVFTKEFFPRFDRQLSDEMRELRDHFAWIKYGCDYARDEGIVRFAQPTPIRESIAMVNKGRLSDPHVNYLLTANPGWKDGDELVCIAKACSDNLTAAGKRLIREW